MAVRVRLIGEAHFFFSTEEGDMHFTEDKQELILAHIEVGLRPIEAAKAEGVGESTFYTWKQKASQGSIEYRDFFDRVTTAQKRAKADRLGAIRRAREGYEVIEEKVVEKDGGVVEITRKISTRRHWQAAAWELQNIDFIDKDIPLQRALEVVSQAIIHNDNEAIAAIEEALRTRLRVLQSESDTADTAMSRSIQ